MGCALGRNLETRRVGVQFIFRHMNVTSKDISSTLVDVLLPPEGF